MPKNLDIKKVLVIGSGPIVIGQAAEFDYAGVQACRALKEEGVEVVLVNSNPATIMTDENMADKVYIEPLTVEALECIIAKERPDSLVAGLGGQTGLNLAVKLYKEGILEKYNVRVLGTKIESIEKAEDRELFKRLMGEIGIPTPESDTVSNFEDAKKFAHKIGYPIIVRPAYTLGGSGGGIASNEAEYEEIVNIGLSLSPISQVLVEKSIAGYKEIEYEVMRDANDTAIIICNMENIDPIGIHTGDSFVVAPSQTLTHNEYQMLRSAAIKIVRALEIEGGCNVQYALDPVSNNYYIIEVNPRVSRSSALASKATGYPIAKVTAKILLGYHLHEIKNAITKKTVAAFEPAIDYVVTKIPKWPFDKFANGDRVLGTKMKATGEVMAIGRTFESSFKKAITSIESKHTGLLRNMHSGCSEDELKALLHVQDDRRIFRVAEALARGVSVDEIVRITKIDKWFITKIKNLVDFPKRMQKETQNGALSAELYMEAKEKGFLDSEIAQACNKTPDEITKFRKDNDISASFKMVDTCAAEFNAATPYFYSTYNEADESASNDNDKKSILILGSGPIRIGQGIEFDYCSVHAAWGVKDNGYKSIIVNSNPETLSTDFDVADRLYFEPMNIENVMNIIEKEKPIGVMTQFGGQTAINLTPELDRRGVEILGSSLESINIAEDRELFEQLLRKLDIPQPRGCAVRTVEEAHKTADELGFPLLVRPSYVIGGRGMQVVYDKDELATYIKGAMKFSNDPILIDQYIEGYEVELDAISDGENVLIPGINEHIERAGIHSGDSISIYPTQKVSERTVSELVDYTQRIARELKIKGLMNIQFVLKDYTTYVIEVNPRASRTIPIMSKVTNVPMVDIAINAILGKSIIEQGYKPGLLEPAPLVCAKIPIFSFQKLNKIDPALAPEMKSTGEVLGIDTTYEKALIKGFIAAGFNISSKRGDVLISVNDHYKDKCIEVAKTLTDLGYRLVATTGTHNFLEAHGVESKEIENFDINKIRKNMKNKELSFIINAPTADNSKGARYGSENRGFLIRTLAELYSTPCFTTLDTAKAYLDAVTYFSKCSELHYSSVDTYRKELTKQG
ncbi:carbamoyl-phosphate synthase large subunit [Candidatus Gastranaerophilus sp. (ex Termes propinquus)]|nr:carbamoyl-phosphate synthase large subunit [Candidatus Gastranaerophilus sp. (ex Termes propinquus)]